jgi:hypothetical protein
MLQLGVVDAPCQIDGGNRFSAFSYGHRLLMKRRTYENPPFRVTTAVTTVCQSMQEMQGSPDGITYSAGVNLPM